MLIAVTREVSPSLNKCELTHLARTEIDVELANEQHRRYQSALAGFGCKVVVLPAEPGLPDAVFVEDTAVVLDEIGVLGRAGVESRRPEVSSIAGILAQYRQLAAIRPPGTLEGGDVLRVGKTIYVGLSGRTNPDGIEQLRALTVGYGYSVQPVAVAGCLHLKSAISQVAPDTLLVNPRWIDKAAFAGFRLIDVADKEPYAANALLVGTGLIYPSSFPRTCAQLRKRKIAVSVVDVSELQKAEGAVTCCSLVFSG